MSLPTVAVIDYGMGNLHSIAKALQHVGGGSVEVVVTSQAERIMGASRVVLPGVGAMRDCMGELQRRGLDTVAIAAAENKPFLGICVGMQALMECSEENDGTRCLGVIPGRVRYFGEWLDDPGSGGRLKVPHMGWNQVRPTADHPLWHGIATGARFYFVHSYYVEPARNDDLCAVSQYPNAFAAAVAHDNIFAVQFHPEKSHSAGLTLLANFLRWRGNDGSSGGALCC